VLEVDSSQHLLDMTIGAQNKLKHKWHTDTPNQTKLKTQQPNNHYLVAVTKHYQRPEPTKAVTKAINAFKLAVLRTSRCEQNSGKAVSADWKLPVFRSLSNQHCTKVVWA
jgi:hypothetical protein